jgi:hypothetical protein
MQKLWLDVVEEIFVLSFHSPKSAAHFASERRAAGLADKLGKMRSFAKSRHSHNNNRAA